MDGSRQAGKSREIIAGKLENHERIIAGKPENRERIVAGKKGNQEVVNNRDRVSWPNMVALPTLYNISSCPLMLRLIFFAACLNLTTGAGDKQAEGT